MNRHFLLSVLFLLTGFFATAQYTVESKYFVYLQTEPAQPFYIKINGQQISANASGYLILPQLKNGDYNLIVGFPNNKAPEQVFDFKIDAKDKGYLIKNFGADGWGLFDLQTMVVQKPLSAEELAKRSTAKQQVENPRRGAPKPEPKQEPKPESIPEVQPTPQPVAQEPAGTVAEPVAAAKPEVEPEPAPTITDHPPAAAEKAAVVPEPEPEAAEGVSDFTKVLAKAAKDPSLLEKPKPKPEPEPAPADAGGGTVTVNPQSAPSVSKDTDEGITLVYDNRNETGQVDPITIFIPRPASGGTSTTKAKQEPAPTAAKKVTPEPASPVAKDTGFKVEEKPVIADENEAAATETSSEPVASGCKSVANEEDFLKLRRAMAMQSNDDEMIAEATKAFKQKCYTTAQVKYLSSMFLSNAGKYNLYAAAASHIADPGQFASLADELKDTFYKDKFSQLIQ